MTDDALSIRLFDFDTIRTVVDRSPHDTGTVLDVFDEWRTSTGIPIPALDDTMGFLPEMSETVQQALELMVFAAISNAPTATPSEHRSIVAVALELDRHFPLDGALTTDNGLGAVTRIGLFALVTGGVGLITE